MMTGCSGNTPENYSCTDFDCYPHDTIIFTRDLLDRVGPAPLNLPALKDRTEGATRRSGAGAAAVARALRQFVRGTVGLRMPARPA
jgi:hypothetical protein